MNTNSNQYNDVLSDLQDYMLYEDNMIKSLKLKIESTPKDIKSIKHSNNTRPQIFIPNQQDSLFWCFYIIKNGDIKYSSISLAPSSMDRTYAVGHFDFNWRTGEIYRGNIMVSGNWIDYWNRQFNFLEKLLEVNIKKNSYNKEHLVYLLENYELHFNYLKTLPEMIDMTPITQPYVFPYSGLVPEDKGITGIVIIAESHLSIHSFQEKEYTFIDIFSCKDFDGNYIHYGIREHGMAASMNGLAVLV